MTLSARPADMLRAPVRVQRPPRRDRDGRLRRRRLRAPHRARGHGSGGQGLVPAVRRRFAGGRPGWSCSTRRSCSSRPVISTATAARRGPRPGRGTAPQHHGGSPWTCPAGRSRRFGRGRRGYVGCVTIVPGGRRRASERETAVELELPDGRPFDAVGRLVAGGIAGRAGLTVDRIDDLQLALQAVRRDPGRGARPGSS